MTTAIPAPTTNVPAPTFGPTGFSAPLESVILAGIQADINSAFGGNLNPGLSTPQGQLASSIAAIVGNVNATFLLYTQMVDPAFSFGRMQDGIARIYFITRNPATFTTLQVSCSGAAGTVIPIGALVVDPSGNQYAAVNAITIGMAGPVIGSFACTVAGPVPVPASLSIAQAIVGWDTATVSSGIVGANTESRAAFEARRAQAVAQNSAGFLPSVRGAVLAVSGVTDAFVTENNLTTSTVVGTGPAAVTIAPNSLYVAVAGGVPSAVAQAIWTKKSPGCNYNGTTQVTVLDQNSGYSPPFPAYVVSFTTAAQLRLLFSINIVNSTAVPSNATSLIQTVIQNFVSGAAGNVKPTIGSLILASSFVASIAALGSWAQVRSLLIGSANAPTVQFTASIAGTVLTVTAISSGTLAIGQTINDVAGLVAPGTTITSLGSGTGGVGTYNLSSSQTVASEAMSASLANGNSVQVGIGQVPTAAPADIVITVS